MIDILVGIAILLAILAVCFLIIYWGFKQINNMLKPKINNITEQKEKVESLEKRVDLLERKLDNK